jgi:transcriptional regulator GlxA family with amidase domain
MSTTVALLLFDQVDLLDLGGPYEVFLTANRLAARQNEPEPFRVVTVGAGPGPVTAYGGLRLTPQATPDELEEVGIVIIPGAIAIEEVAANEGVRPAVAALTERALIRASVCTGAFLLADVGLLDGRPFTTHWEDLDALADRVGSGRAVDGVRWVDTRDVVTAGGLSSGIAMALHLVDRIRGREPAVATARQLDYDWDPGKP